MEEFVMNKVMSIYGNFSTFTVPILSFEHIHDLSQQFKTKLPRYHEMISVLLYKFHNTKHKKHRHKHAQWDHFILYVFCMLQRIRNKRNFIWWALCNAASQYGEGNNIMSCYFGFTLHNKTVLKKITEHLDFNAIMAKTKKTLNDGDSFIIVIFDNAQELQVHKHQRGGK
jgi:hypothetical protein